MRYNNIFKKYEIYQKLKRILINLKLKILNPTFCTNLHIPLIIICVFLLIKK